MFIYKLLNLQKNYKIIFENLILFKYLIYYISK